MASSVLTSESSSGRINELMAQFVFLVLTFVLAVDELNPVKVVCKFSGIPDKAVAVITLLVFIALAVYNFQNIVYYSLRIYLHSILSIFFKKIELVGVKNIPTEGPVIFTGNHANQFADAVIVLMTCQRKVGFIIAEKSWNLPVIGFLAKILGCIPVARPQDSTVLGTGVAYMDKSSNDQQQFLLRGNGTKFATELKPKDAIRYRGSSSKSNGPPVKVLKVLNDEETMLSGNLLDSEGQPVKSPSQFRIVPHQDQSGMFDAVYRHLKNGNCIGIFPEGGSHDRTDLLPLKAGVAIMAHGVKEKYQMSVPVVPVGLNYFRGHRFRARVIVEFGQPIYLSTKDAQEYRRDHRLATNKFLEKISDGMRAVIVTAPDYDTLQGIYMARRLFQPDGIQHAPRVVQDLNRRFAEGYRIIESRFHGDSSFIDLKKRVLAYRLQLKELGLKDHQVPLVRWFDSGYVINRFLHAFCVICMTALPTLFLNAPVGVLARWAANVEREKALKSSEVKVAALDVMLSRKILVSMVGVPILWISYALFGLLFVRLPWNVVLMTLIAFPLFSYFGVITTEAGMIAMSDLRPLFLRLLPSFRRKQNDLARERVLLKQAIRDFIFSHKESLGELFYAKPFLPSVLMQRLFRQIDWHQYMTYRDKRPRDDEEQIHEGDKDIVEDGVKAFVAASEVHAPITPKNEVRKKAD